jgi:hypothetical protein
MEIKVCDMIMGAGKTESAITQMLEDTESRYIFITPYLDEVERIKHSCAERDFRDPQNRGDGKLEVLHWLLRRRHNIASTHALFRAYTEETLQLIAAGGYKLILDEVADVVEPVPLSSQDLAMLLEERMLTIDSDGRVRWLREGYEGKFEELRDMCLTGHVVSYYGKLMLWTFPIEVFTAFQEIIILTYLFDAQVQKYYFDLHGVQTRYIGTRQEDGRFRFTENTKMPAYVQTLRDKIHILEDGKLNAVGDRHTALSATWYAKERKVKGQPQLRRLRNNLVNVFINRFGSPCAKNLWTTFKDYKDTLKGRGYTKGFLSYNTRATNAYRDRTHLAYCVNVFYNPLLKNYFLDNGVAVYEDAYALSEMIQWIWRSAIRDGQEIWIYIPSRRMRQLLRDWLDELAEN